jgi:hypothetical protein
MKDCLVNWKQMEERILVAQSQVWMVEGGCCGEPCSFASQSKHISGNISAAVSMHFQYQKHAIQVMSAN